MSKIIDQLEKHIHSYRQLERDVLELWMLLPSFKAAAKAHGPFPTFTTVNSFKNEHKVSLARIIDEARDFLFSFMMTKGDPPPEECPCGCTEEEQ